MCILHTSRLLLMKPGEIHNTPPSAHTNIHPSEQDAAICYPPCYFLEGKLSRPRTFAQPLDALACARDPCSETAAQYSITIPTPIEASCTWTTYRSSNVSGPTSILYTLCFMLGTTLAYDRGTRLRSLLSILRLWSS
ncbi:hypothetical protein KQX54_004508 [Cotesia glomerata]|uniref:Uncharacterized protein n=1 Tax=Cotesia glomerata TaxID=32391 RepID=A0AAV7HYP6_COTGL|nr:hypothetical protein KQX54_004508 [Cotesia glomerata]